MRDTGSGMSDEGFEEVQIPPVERVHVGAPPALRRIELRRLEQHRQLREPRVVDEPSERLDADAALADVLVPIDTARARLLRVVQVEGLEARKPHDPSELT